MKSRNLRKIFVSVFSAVAVLAGAFSGMIPTKASLSFGAENQEVHVLKGTDSEADSEKADEEGSEEIPECDSGQYRLWL